MSLNLVTKRSQAILGGRKTLAHFVIGSHLSAARKAFLNYLVKKKRMTILNLRSHHRTPKTKKNHPVLSRMRTMATRTWIRGVGCTTPL